MLAACGTPPALFDDSDGTSQRAFRRYLTTVVQPLAGILERELADSMGSTRTTYKGRATARSLSPPACSPRMISPLDSVTKPAELRVHLEGDELR